MKNYIALTLMIALATFGFDSYAAKKKVHKEQGQNTHMERQATKGTVTKNAKNKKNLAKKKRFHRAKKAAANEETEG